MLTLSSCLFCALISLFMSMAMFRRLPSIPLTAPKFSSISSSRASFVILPCHSRNACSPCAISCCTCTSTLNSNRHRRTEKGYTEKGCQTPSLRQKITNWLLNSQSIVVTVLRQGGQNYKNVCSISGWSVQNLIKIGWWLTVIIKNVASFFRHSVDVSSKAAVHHSLQAVSCSNIIHKPSGRLTYSFLPSPQSPPSCSNIIHKPSGRLTYCFLPSPQSPS